MKRLAIINSLNGIYHLIQYDNNDFYLLGDDIPSLDEMKETNFRLWDFEIFMSELESMIDTNDYECIMLDEDFISYVENAINECEDETLLYNIGSHYFIKYDENYIFDSCSLKLHEMELL